MSSVPLAPVPLESPESMPFSARLVDTLALLFMRPLEFFQRLEPVSSPLRALFFGMVCIIVGVIFSAFWQSMDPQAQEHLAQLLGPDAPPVRPAHLVLAAPLASVFDLGFNALLLHGLCRIFGGRGRLGRGLQIVGYAAAAEPLSLIPAVGPIFASVVRLIFMARGVEVLYGVSRPKAWLICLIPLLAGLTCLGGLM